MSPTPPKVNNDTLLAFLLFFLCCIFAFVDKAQVVAGLAGVSLP